MSDRVPHSQMPPAARHPLPRWVVANEAALAALTVTSVDVYKVAVVVDSSSLWLLTDDTPATWLRVIDLDYLSDALADYATTAAVVSALASYATTAAMTSALAAKADSSALAAKASTAYVDAADNALATSIATKTTLAAANDQTPVTSAATAITLAAAHVYKPLRSTSGTTCVITCPSDASEPAIPVGAWGTVEWRGVAQPSFAQGSGATLNGTKLKISAAENSVKWTKIAADTYELTGAVSA